MLKSTLRRGWLLAGLAAIGFMLSASAPSDSFARHHRSGKVVRKASHSTRARRGRHGKSASTKNHHASRTLGDSEKEVIIAKLKSVSNVDTETAQVADSLIDSTNISEAAAPLAINLSAVYAPMVQQDATAVMAMSFDPDYFHANAPSLLEATDTMNVSRADVVGHIIDWLGTRYVFGGDSPKGIDCSAFTRDIFRKSFNVDLPRTAAMQSVLGEKVDRSGLAFGDMVFFKTDRYAPVTHVGIYVGSGLFANAQCSRGVTLASLDDPYWSAKFLFGKRLYTREQTAHAEVNKNLDYAVASGELQATYHQFD